MRFPRRSRFLSLCVLLALGFFVLYNVVLSLPVQRILRNTIPTRESRDLASKGNPPNSDISRLNKIRTLKPEPGSELHRERDRGLVVYNRVPKCASTTARLLLAEMARQDPGSFTLHVESWPKIQQTLSPEDQQKLVDKWTSLKKPVVVVRHLQYIDFTSYGFPSPLYINIVRHPVDHFVSSYYFRRFGFEGWDDHKWLKWLGKMPENKRFMSIDDCIARNVTKCARQNPAHMLAFFCGQHARCRHGSEWSLLEAKRNVEKDFVVVGLAEDLPNTVRLFQAFLPRFFGNFEAVYNKVKDRLPSTRTARKKQPRGGARKKLQKALFFEMQFYEFLKSRFEKQLESFGIT